MRVNQILKNGSNSKSYVPFFNFINTVFPLKRFVLALFALLSAGTALFAQQAEMPNTLAAWAEHVKSFGTKIPQEEVFVHMDNTSYFLGDTIYYKAYLRRSDGAPSNLSGLLYVELFSPDGFLVERQKLKMVEGHGYGAFALEDSLYAGYYELRAYTSWQLNWGEYEHPHTKYAEDWFYNKKMAKEYYRDYEKLYSRVFPVYDSPLEPGDYTEDMTVRPLQRYFKKDNSSPKAKVTFFPEGGWLVSGTTCRVAFQADDEDGRHLDGTLTVKNKNGQEVASVPVSHRGCGVFTLNVAPGEDYKAEFAWGKNKQKFDLPEVVTDGVAMQVRVDDDELLIDLQSSGSVAQKKLGVTVLSHGIMQDFKELGSGDKLNCKFKTKNYPSGVIQVTVFDAEGTIYADRLAFVRHDDKLKEQQMTFSGISATAYAPFAPIKIGVNGKAGSTVSVAVRDAAHSEYIYDNGNILTEMLLSSQIRGFIEDPTYYFESNDEEHCNNLDLLLMVQGWRRYDWRILATPNTFTLKYMPERTQHITGDVNRYTAQIREDFNRVDADALMAEADARMAESASSDGESEDSDAVSTISIEASDFNDTFKENITPYGTVMAGRTDTKIAEEMFPNENEGKLKREVLIHVEYVQPGVNGQRSNTAEGEMSTSNSGQFQFDAPSFEEGIYFFLGAADTARWKRKKITPDTYEWLASGEDQRGEVNYPDYYVRLSHIYPRFVKPYVFYQENLAPIPAGSKLKADPLGRTHDLQEITVGATRNGKRQFDKNTPAFVIDAYEAFNEVCDAGFCPGYYLGQSRFMYNLARNYVGDMGMERAYFIEPRYNGRNLTGIVSDGERNKYNRLSTLDKVYIFTDYSPRLEGDSRFSQDNQPIVSVDLHRFMDDGERNTWRDRRYILYGYSACYEFYQPDYSKKPLPSTKDYRRTLYWNPNLKLDGKGHADLLFYNNSKNTQITVSAEGLGADGTPVTGLSTPESR